MNENLTQQRLVARLTSIFGLLALGLACLGLYGVMSYIVQRRISEIGVRLALGSPRPAVLWLVLKETLLLISAGSLIGIVLSVFAMRLATSFLFGSLAGRSSYSWGRSVAALCRFARCRISPGAPRYIHRPDAGT